MKNADRLRIALVGIGKIARDQHLPTIAAHPEVELVAAVSRSSRVDGVPTFTTLEGALTRVPQIQAVVLCGPPVGRHLQAHLALDAGRHVFLEKPPGATLSEVENLRAQAERAKVALFASWHSRYAAGVEPARQWLKDTSIKRVHVAWKEDVRKWHPGQDWIFAAGGMGVFDPGINALSIVTHIFPRPFHLKDAQLDIPSDRQAPVRAKLGFVDAHGVTLSMDLDFLHRGEECWDINVETDDGRLKLSRGGALLEIDGLKQSLPTRAEYASLYDRFVELVKAGESDVDTAPLGHVADVFLLGERRIIEPFSW